MKAGRVDRGFRWRGGEVSRLEGFSDAVFGFALTLLVVSLEVPRTFAQLAETMRGFFAFAFSFALLLVVWEKHYRFFRRYGLQDGTTLLLNSLLLFVVLFYVYPLKFVSTAFIEGVLFHRRSVVVEVTQIPTLFTIYGAGYVAIFAIYGTLYLHARRNRAALELSPFEAALTNAEVLHHAALCAVGFVAIALARLLPVGLSGLSGFAYVLIGPVETWHGAREGRLRRELAAPSADPADRPES
jgi:uncharacterized membrane protein